jgi:hypothetical protein
MRALLARDALIDDARRSREHAPRDDYWGRGADGHGKNRLGQILMEVRADLHHQDKRRIPPLEHEPDAAFIGRRYALCSIVASGSRDGHDL